MEKPKLENMEFMFSQDGNCISDRDEVETITITCESSIGIDRDNSCFFILKTDKWSIDGIDDLEELFNRIRKIINK